jgi:hypothetical protein
VRTLAFLWLIFSAPILAQKIEVSLTDSLPSARCATALRSAEQALAAGSRPFSWPWRTRKAFAGPIPDLLMLVRDARLAPLLLKAIGSLPHRLRTPPREALTRQTITTLIPTTEADAARFSDPALIACVAHKDCPNEYPWPTFFIGDQRSFDHPPIGPYERLLPSGPDVLFVPTPRRELSPSDFVGWFSHVVFSVAWGKGLELLDAVIQSDEQSPSFLADYVTRSGEKPTLSPKVLVWYLVGRSYLVQDDFVHWMGMESRPRASEALTYDRIIQSRPEVAEELSRLKIGAGNFYDSVLTLEKLLVLAANKALDP